MSGEGRLAFGRLRSAGLRAGRGAIGQNVGRAGVTLALAFVVLAAGAGYWQVYRAQELSTAPDRRSARRRNWLAVISVQEWRWQK